MNCHPERKGPQALFSLGVVSEGSAVAFRVLFTRERTGICIFSSADFAKNFGLRTVAAIGRAALEMDCRLADTIGTVDDLSPEGFEPCRCTPIAAPNAATSLRESRTSAPRRRQNVPNATVCSSALSQRPGCTSKAPAGMSTTTRPRTPPPPPIRLQLRAPLPPPSPTLPPQPQHPHPLRPPRQLRPPQLLPVPSQPCRGHSSLHQTPSLPPWAAPAGSATWP